MQINGILLPGGDSPLWKDSTRTEFSDLMKSIKYIIDLAI